MCVVCNSSLLINALDSRRTVSYLLQKAELMVVPRITLRQIEAGLDPNARLLPRYCFVFVLFLWTPKEVD